MHFLTRKKTGELCRIAAFLLLVLAVFPTMVHAELFAQREIMVLASMDMPFGGGGSDLKKLTLNLAVDFVRTEPIYGISHRTAQPIEPAVFVNRLIDIRVNALNRKWDRFRVGGADALTYTTHLNADGSTTTEPGGFSTDGRDFPWLAVGGASVFYLILSSNKKEGGCSDPLASSPRC